MNVVPLFKHLFSIIRSTRWVQKRVMTLGSLPLQPRASPRNDTWKKRQNRKSAKINKHNVCNIFFLMFHKIWDEDVGSLWRQVSRRGSKRRSIFLLFPPCIQMSNYSIPPPCFSIRGRIYCNGPTRDKVIYFELLQVRWTTEHVMWCHCIVY